LSIYRLTWFPRREESWNGLRVTLARDELRFALSDPARHDNKDTLPLICAASFRAGHRADEDVEEVSLLGLDLDEPTPDPGETIATVRAALGDVEVYAYSTFSSEAERLKLRAFVPYDEPASGDDHRASWFVAARMLSAAGIEIDPKCKNESRGYYVWSIPPSGVYWHAHVPGEPWPVSLAAASERKRAEEEHTRRKREAKRVVVRAGGDVIARARAYLAKCDPAIQGSDGSTTTLVVAAKLLHGFGLSTSDALALMRAEYNHRCKPPWSDADLGRKVDQAADKWRGSDRGWLLNAEERKAS
jgi:hypothetical protein